MMTALLAARNILAGKQIYDVWSVNEEAEYHESGSAARIQGMGRMIWRLRGGHETVLRIDDSRAREMILW